METTIMGYIGIIGLSNNYVSAPPGPAFKISGSSVSNITMSP